MYLLPIIVVNSPDIEENILKLNTSSLDLSDIARLWKVFYSARRNISDPTVKWIRLENYWWRIWGSKQKNQSGLILGDLFCRILNQSNPFTHNGLTSSDEKSSTLKGKNRSYAGAEAQRKVGDITAIEPTVKDSHQNISNTIGVIPHPILKKTRGPSSNGPRPTARFISPHETEDEHSVVPTKHKTTVQLASISTGDLKSDRKRITGPTISKKKSAFVSPRKKQSVVHRRQKSHSSGDNSSRVAGSIQIGTKPSSITAKLSPPPVPQTPTKINSRLEDSPVITKKNSNISQTLVLYKASSCTNTNPSSLHLHHTSQNQKKPPTHTLRETNVSSGLCQVEDSQVEKSSKCHGNSSIIKEIQPPGSQSNMLATLKSHSCESISGDDCSSFTQVKQHLIKPSCQPLLESKQKKSSPAKTDTYNLAKTNIFEPITTGPAADVMKNRKNFYSAVITRQGINPHKLDGNKSHLEEYRIPADVFAKRPFQISMSASTSTDILSRSKSQLTLLLERDRVSTAGKYSNQGKDRV